MEDKDINSYLFWLTEYLCRKFHRTDEPNLVLAAAKEAVATFAKYYQFTVTGNTLSDFSNMTLTREYQRIHYYKTVYERKHLAGKLPAKTLEATQIEINYSLNNDDNRIFEKTVYATDLMNEAYNETLKDSWLPAESKEVISVAVNNKFILPDDVYALFLERIGSNIHSAHGYIGFPFTVEGNMLILPDLSINMAVDTQLLANEFFMLIESFKNSYFPYETKFHNVKTGNIATNHIKRYIKITPEIRYNPKSNNIRAVGIWLWDFVLKHPGSVSAAIRELKNQIFLTPLGFTSSSERHFMRAYTKTSECIEKGEVLLMS